MELPRLEELWLKHRDTGVSVVAVEGLRDRERAVKFINDNKLTYHLLEEDEGGAVVRGTFRVRAFPTSYLIDRHGKIMYGHVGFEKGDEVRLEKEILELGGG